MNRSQAERFELMWRAHAGEVLAYCRRRSPTSAEDALAETFLVAWRRLDQLPAEPLPWLFGVARRILANQRRAASRGEALLQRIGEDELRRDQVTREPSQVIEAVEMLSETDRETLRLQAWEGLSAADAAVVLGCSAVAFRLRLHRARRRLERAVCELESGDASQPLSRLALPARGGRND